MLQSSLTWSLQNQHVAIKHPHPHCFLSDIAIVSCRNRTFSIQSTYCFSKLYQLKKAVSAHSFSWAMPVWTLLRPHILVKGLNWLKGSPAQSQGLSKNTDCVSADSNAEQAHQVQKCLIHLSPSIASFSSFLALSWVFDSLSYIKLLFCSPFYPAVVFFFYKFTNFGKGREKKSLLLQVTEVAFLLLFLGLLWLFCSFCLFLLHLFRGGSL